MTGTNKAIFCWSGGKDSAFCLYKVLREGSWDVRYLLTTINGHHNRISMHGVREELLDMQASSVGIPLLKLKVYEADNAEYEREMEALLLKCKSEGIHTVIFGDIFLEDLRRYRENNLAKIGMNAVFPLWKSDTAQLLQQFIDTGFKTITCCTNDAWLGKEWAGRIIDNSFVNELPAGTDPCGENGEYHSFCYDGPLFSTPVHVETGEILYKPLDIRTNTDGEDSPDMTKGFWFCDLVAVSV